MSLCADAIANCEREAGVFIVSEEPKMLEAFPDTIQADPASNHAIQLVWTQSGEHWKANMLAISARMISCQ